MSPKISLPVLSLVAAFTSCSPEAPPAQSAPPPPRAETPRTTASPMPAPTAAKKGNATLIGTVVTDPYSAVKKGAVVYLEDGPKEPGAGMSATIDNHDMTFVPFISVVTAGGTVTFGNTDPMVHNAFSPDGEKWDVGAIPSRGAVPRTFDTPNVYSVLCNLHKNMLAYLVVTPSSYFAKVDADGKYSLKVPPGTYKVTAWSPRLQPTTHSVTATDGEVTLNFELHR